MQYCRDADDHVNWLLEHGFHEKALAAVEDGKVSTERMEEVCLSCLLATFWSFL